MSGIICRKAPQMSGIIIRRAAPEDTEKIMELERNCMKHPWSEEDIKALTGDDLKAAFAALDEEDIVGYIGLSFVADEGEIGNLCVAEGYRRRGIATSLLDEAMGFLKSKGIKTVFLEVARSNKGAFDLYMRSGFEHYHTRELYYGDEDALLCRRYL